MSGFVGVQGCRIEGSGLGLSRTPQVPLNRTLMALNSGDLG